jgi:hypothetical protein
VQSERLANADVFKLPVLGVAVPCAVGNVLLTMLVQIIVTLTSAGCGMEAPPRFSMFVTFVKRLIYRNARRAKAHRFQSGASRQWRKNHEADESDNSCYCSLDICMCGAAFLRLV